jgi:hypothetical protein
MEDSIIYSKMPQYDVFVYGRPGEPIICYLCSFGDIMDSVFKAESTLEMEGHLKAHLNKGDILPSNIFDEISKNSQVHYRPKKQ